MFKINKEDAPEAILEMFRHNDYSYNTRSVASDNFSVYMTHLSIGKTAITYTGPKLRNSIPRLIKQSESLESFKNNFKDYLLIRYSVRLGEDFGVVSFWVGWVLVFIIFF